MTTEEYEMKFEEAMRRAKDRCEEILANNGYLTERDALLILYDELHVDPPPFLQLGSAYGYSWLDEPIKSIDERFASSKDEV